MFKWILALMIGVPILELYLIVKVGSMVGLLPTLAMCVITAVIGGSLAKKQGLKVLFQLQEEISYGHNPTESLLDGVCILVGGLVLLFPGFFTDVVGFALLVPFIRTQLKNILRSQIDKKMMTSTVVYRSRKDVTDYE